MPLRRESRREACLCRPNPRCFRSFSNSCATMAGMKRCLLIYVLAVAPAFLIAQKIEAEFDQAANFSQFKSFTLREGQINAKAPSLNNDLVRKRIENDIRTALTAKGLFEASTGLGDLIV